MPFATVRVGDIVPHERPARTRVARLVACLRAGGRFPAIEIDGRWREHWTQGPRGMESIGTGYGLLDGHARHAALLRVFGADAEVEASIAGELEPRPARPLRECIQGG